MASKCERVAREDKQPPLFVSGRAAAVQCVPVSLHIRQMSFTRSRSRLDPPAVDTEAELC